MNPEEADPEDLIIEAYGAFVVILIDTVQSFLPAYEQQQILQTVILRTQDHLKSENWTDDQRVMLEGILHTFHELLTGRP